MTTHKDPALAAPERLDEGSREVWDETRARFDELGDDFARIVGPDFEAYCSQVALQRDARRRIASEGVIVADVRDHPEPHPAVAIERAAQKEIRDWGDKFRPKRPRPGRAGR